MVPNTLRGICLHVLLGDVPKANTKRLVAHKLRKCLSQAFRRVVAKEAVFSVTYECVHCRTLFASDPKSRSKRSRYSSENDVLIEKSVKYTDFFLLSIVYV